MFYFIFSYEAMSIVYHKLTVTKSASLINISTVQVVLNGPKQV